MGISAEIRDGTPALHGPDGQPLDMDVALTRIVSHAAHRRVSDVLAATAVPTVNDPDAALVAGAFDPDDITARLGLPLIVKPVRGMQGHGIELLHTRDGLRKLADADHDTEPLIAQRYIPEAQDGDLRVLVISGHAIAAMRRLPATGERRSNLHVGGVAVPHELTD